MSVGSAIPGVRGLSKGDATKMSAIGGALVTPGWIIIVLLTCGFFEAIHTYIYEILKARAEQGPRIFPFLWRQVEALIWLFTPAPQH